MHKLEIVDAPARRLFAVSHRGPYAEIAPAFSRLADLLAEHGLRAAAGERVAVYCDDPEATPAAGLRAHAGVAVDAALAPAPGLEDVRLAAGRHAVVRVVGPYARLRPAYAWLYAEGLAAAGLAPGEGPSYEVYRNDPSDTPADALVTDIFAPVAPKPG